MDHRDHVNLLRRGIESAGGVWADFGAGSGAFTLALAELLGATGAIYAIDRDARALRENAKSMAKRFPAMPVQYEVADFTRRLTLPRFDGIVMANALHFQADQLSVVRLLREYLCNGGRMLIVEYNIDWPNRAVPYPVPYGRWETLAREAGFGTVKLLARRPSRTFGEIYSAAAW
jgi:ubiquinone/menaquinone biosynthesis C-methylase UbiE